MNLKTVANQDLTRVNNDVNGNPRYVFHYTSALPAEMRNSSFLQWSGMKYEIAVMLASEFLDGRKFHSKQYGGGIVFQSYNTRYDLDRAADAYETSDLKYYAYHEITLWAKHSEKSHAKGVEIATKIKEGTIDAKLGFFQMKDLAEEIANDMKAWGFKVKKNQKVLTLAAAYLMVTFEENVNSK